MLVAASCQFSGINPSPMVGGWLELVWAASWFSGVVIGGFALGQHARGSPLILAPFYPVFGWIYIVS